MLFKQWNDIEEPRHHLDSIALGNEDSLQRAGLPEVELPRIDWSRFTKIFFTTAIMVPLFPGELLNARNLGDIKTVLTLDSVPQKADFYSWNFEENFPNEVNPGDSAGAGSPSKSFTFVTPVVAFDDSLLVVVKENFLKVSPIIYNQIAKALVSRITSGPHKQQLIVLGMSDRITELKFISHERCDLQPPEFVTGFVGSVLTQLILNRLPFEGFVAPSEGAMGFEKMNMGIMPELIDICNRWTGVDPAKYKKECYRYWRLDGAAGSSLSGLYI